jgi:hypothetical protein
VPGRKLGSAGLRNLASRSITETRLGCFLAAFATGFFFAADFFAGAAAFAVLANEDTGTQRAGLAGVLSPKLATSFARSR